MTTSHNDRVRSVTQDTRVPGTAGVMTGVGGARQTGIKGGGVVEVAVVVESGWWAAGDISKKSNNNKIKLK